MALSQHLQYILQQNGLPCAKVATIAVYSLLVDWRELTPLKQLLLKACCLAVTYAEACNLNLTFAVGQSQKDSS